MKNTYDLGTREGEEEQKKKKAEDVVTGGYEQQGFLLSSSPNEGTGGRRMGEIAVFQRPCPRIILGTSLKGGEVEGSPRTRTGSSE